MAAPGQCMNMMHDGPLLHRETGWSWEGWDLYCSAWQQSMTALRLLSTAISASAYLVSASYKSSVSKWRVTVSGGIESNSAGRRTAQLRLRPCLSPDALLTASIA